MNSKILPIQQGQHLSSFTNQVALNSIFFRPDYKRRCSKPIFAEVVLLGISDKGENSTLVSTKTRQMPRLSRITFFHTLTWI
jgi:hypothetical protein